jgi:hypothetical protein
MFSASKGPSGFFESTVRRRLAAAQSLEMKLSYDPLILLLSGKSRNTQVVCKAGLACFRLTCRAAPFRILKYLLFSDQSSYTILNIEALVQYS